MLRRFVRSTIERARVTRAEPESLGAVAIDTELLAAADLLPLEQVELHNLSRGTRVPTHCIAGRSGSGEVAVHGSDAFAVGDVVTVCAHCLLRREDVPHHRARVVLVDARNRVTEIREATPFDLPGW